MQQPQSGLVSKLMKGGFEFINGKKQKGEYTINELTQSIFGNHLCVHVLPERKYY